MIGKEAYEKMKSLYGDVGSWTIWGEKTTDKAKSGIGDMAWLDRPDLLDTLDTGFVFVGLNWSRLPDSTKTGPWRNFHTGRSVGQYYKLRHALKGTRYWGSYITDFLKYYPEKDSHEAMKWARKSPGEIERNVKTFEDELSHLKGNPALVALGDEAYQLLKENLGDKYRIVRVMHYAKYINPDVYRQKVLEVLDSTMN